MASTAHPKTRPHRLAPVEGTLHFPWPKLSAALDELRAASRVRQLYGRKTGKGLWLVGDQGVYLMPNTTVKKRTTVYARECDPTKLEFDAWWAAKRATFGGDDGIEFIPIEDIERLAPDSPKKPGIVPQHLAIAMTPERLVLSLVWNSNPARSAKGAPEHS
jgi:hypothetical protein